MSARDLAGGYTTYTSADELTAAVAAAAEGTGTEPTTSIATTMCITTPIRG
ncbi:MAG: LxmA leader domain family RiPP [Streptosporangiaceae bacterium]